MGNRGWSLAPTVVGLVGLALVALESIQAMRSKVIGGLGTTLLFVGLGLFVLAAAIAVVGLTSDPTPAAVPAFAESPTEPAPSTD